MDIGKVISRSFDVLFKNVVVLAVAMFLAELIGGVTIGILMGPMLAGMVIISLKLLRGETAEIGDVFKGMDKFGPAFLVLLLTYLAVGAIWLATIIFALIPFLGILVTVLLWICLGIAFPLIGAFVAFALCTIVDKNLDLGGAFKFAIDRIKVNPLEIWVLALVLGILSSIGSIACGIGVFVTAPIFILGMTIMYLEGTSATTQPSVTA